MMPKLSVPNAVPFDKVLASGFSPRNFASVSIKRTLQAKLRDFLSEEQPSDKGVEPGGSSYVKESTAAFVRNSCINFDDYATDHLKYQSINPNLGYENSISNGDILLCKDANIGDAAIFNSRKGSTVSINSSGIVKLNITDPHKKYYILACLKDQYFRDQLDAVTPRGSTIRHAGDRYLNCKIPVPSSDESWVYGTIESLVKNIVSAEVLSEERLDTGYEIITNTLDIKPAAHGNPAVGALLSSGRIDAGFYSSTVQQLAQALASFDSGTKTLAEAGFQIKRGPNLAKRDLGRSIVTEQLTAGYDTLIYPSDISDRGYLSRQAYIGARGKIWHLGLGDILFSAEGTVGRVFAVCDDRMKFTTNFHGIIISHLDRNLKISSFLAMYLHFLRKLGYFDKVSVGGQGGSFASSYWDLILVPNFSTEVQQQLADLYHFEKHSLDPFTHSDTALKTAGIFELSQLRGQCKSILLAIMNDLKNDKVLTEEHYRDQYEKAFSISSQ